MHPNTNRFVLAAACAAAVSFGTSAQSTRQAEFRTHVVDASNGGGTVLAVDINKDGKLDIVANQSPNFVWYENPSWERHLIADGKPGTIAHDAYDTDGDGIPELVLLNGFAQVHEKSEGNIWLFEHQGDPRQRWKERIIDKYPSAHHLAFADIVGDGKKVLIVGPLTGPGSTPPFLDGKVSMFWYQPGEWKRMTIVDNLTGINHRIRPVQWDTDKRQELLTAGYDGIMLHHASGGANSLKWERTVLNPAYPKTAGEDELLGGGDVGMGQIGGKRFLASVEGFTPSPVVAVYMQDAAGKWTRRVLFDKLVNGHDVAVGDFNGDKRDDIVAGDRGGKGEQMVTHVFYGPSDPAGEWTHQTLPGLSAGSNITADINGDGKMDIIATGGAGEKISAVHWYENLGAGGAGSR